MMGDGENGKVQFNTDFSPLLRRRAHMYSTPSGELADRAFRFTMFFVPTVAVSTPADRLAGHDSVV